jgi:hypothetical protein
VLIGPVRPQIHSPAGDAQRKDQIGLGIAGLNGGGTSSCPKSADGRPNNDHRPWDTSVFACEIAADRPPRPINDIQTQAPVGVLEGNPIHTHSEIVDRLPPALAGQVILQPGSQDTSWSRGTVDSDGGTVIHSGFTH